jgi:hypothetical protein
MVTCNSIGYFTLMLHDLLCWKCRPQNDHVERSDLAKRFFIAGWERERAKGGEAGA